MESPVTRSQNTRLLKKIEVKKIIDGYATSFGMDVEKYFKNLEYIELYLCNDTHYKFFYPFDIDGDSDFYEKLQKFEWYYMPWKWEHELTLRLVKRGDHVLEMGCAQGDFLQKLKASGVLETGLEINEEAVKEGIKKGLNVQRAHIQDFVKSHAAEYDLVCSFQVLEHISDVSDVLKASVDLLKKGGRLVVAVPNDDSFIKYDSHAFLNMPPHHMGLWNEEALSNLDKVFDLRVESIHFEPLQEYHFNYYSEVVSKHLSEKFFFSNNLVRCVIRPVIRFILPLVKSKIIGHTILIVYEKPRL